MQNVTPSEGRAQEMAADSECQVYRFPWQARQGGAPRPVLPSCDGLRVVGARVDALTLAAGVSLGAIVASWREEEPEGEEAPPRVLRVPLTGWVASVSLVELAVKKLRGGRYYLENADLRAVIDENPIGGCELEVTFRASFLATNSLETARAYVYAIATTLGVMREERLRRLDLSCDVSGWTFQDSDRRSFVKPGRSAVTTFRELAEEKSVLREHGDDRITGYTVSPGGPIMLRIYDKREQLAKKAPEKTALEEAIWSSNGWSGKGSVARVEFQLRSEALRSFGIVGAEGLESKLDALWQYLTRHWVRIVEVDRSRLTRCKTLDNRWKLVQALAFTHQSAPAARRYDRGGASVQQALGGLLSFVSRGIEAEALCYFGTLPSEEETAREALAAYLNRIAIAGAAAALDALLERHGNAVDALAWGVGRGELALARASTVGGGAAPPPVKEGRVWLGAAA